MPRRFIGKAGISIAASRDPNYAACIPPRKLQRQRLNDVPLGLFDIGRNADAAMELCPEAPGRTREQRKAHLHSQDLRVHLQKP